MAMTHTYTTKDGPHSEAISLARVTSLLTRSFATGASQVDKGGYATIVCHIAADHMVDVCILEREYPQRVGYGQSLEALFNGHISVADQDALGRPTAHRLLGLAVKWEVSR